MRRLAPVTTVISLVLLPVVLALVLGPVLGAASGPEPVVLTMGPGAAAPTVATANGLVRLVAALGTSVVFSAGVWLTATASRRFD